MNDEDEEKLRNKTLKSIQKGIVKRKDFRHLSNCVGKGENQGIRKIEVVEGDGIICIRNKDEIEHLIITHNREHVSKIKKLKRVKMKHMIA